MKLEDMVSITDVICGSVSRNYNPRIEALLDRIEELEKTAATAQESAELLRQRIAVLESAPGFKYGGVFDTTKVYCEGTMVTDSNKLWLKTADGGAGFRPPGNNWKLIARSGEHAQKVFIS